MEVEPVLPAHRRPDNRFLGDVRQPHAAAHPVQVQSHQAAVPRQQLQAQVPLPAVLCRLVVFRCDSSGALLSGEPLRQGGGHRAELVLQRPRHKASGREEVHRKDAADAPAVERRPRQRHGRRASVRVVLLRLVVLQRRGGSGKVSGQAGERVAKVQLLQLHVRLLPRLLQPDEPGKGVQPVRRLRLPVFLRLHLLLLLQHNENDQEEQRELKRQRQEQERQDDEDNNLHNRHQRLLLASHNRHDLRELLRRQRQGLLGAGVRHRHPAHQQPDQPDPALEAGQGDESEYFVLVPTIQVQVDTV